MKRTLLLNLLVAVVFLGTSTLLALDRCGAAEEHHKPGAGATAPASTESRGSGMMQGQSHQSTGGHGMMSHMMGSPGGMGKMMGHMGGCMKGCGGIPGMAQMANILKDLNLTSEQWKEVRTSARKRLDKMADLWAERMKLQMELASLDWDKEMDPQKVKSLFVKEAEAKAEMFLTSSDYLRKLRKVLTPDQLEKLGGYPW